MKHVRRLSRDQIGEAIFGIEDGVVSILGVEIGFLSSGGHTHLLAIVLGLAVAATVSMAGGQYLGDDKKRLGLALVMGLSTLIGTVIPAVPIILFGTGWLGVTAMIGVVMATGASIAAIRPGGIRSWLETFGILGIASLAAILVPLFTGAA